MVREADFIYVMSGDEGSKYLLNSPKVTFWKVKDPFELSIPATTKIMKLIKKKVLTITRE